MPDQVDIDLKEHTRQSLTHLGSTAEVEGAPEVEEWKEVSMIWQDQPPKDRIQLFVKLPATGEQKQLLQIEHHLETFFPLFHFSYALVASRNLSHSLADVALRFFINIVPIDEGKASHRVRTNIRASAKIVELQDHISKVLQAEMYIGANLHSPLDILPMQAMPTLDDLKKQDLSALRTMAHQQKDLPSDIVSDFFSAQDLDKIHFLVWLPPADRECCDQIHLIPA